ncbi:FAD-dependent oxidoreductase [Nocardioides marmoriginsengisoli]|uniref:FAD-dependent oxidoreductase n=1 Tax=Nocardioides marmoriginsengisoli TaxID=661483 RepID=A0A3N0CBX2_9ACTN|nr:FAD-dependent oxidoreductase [Nocardioides marmoriginsengisoli]RNL60799.1 FAD-dependent oxidoreductase [Nocardioides marmoriginsengisoli]
MATPQPSRAQVVVIGGGIVGTSVAYHLTKLGVTDVVVLEQGKLSGGTTWHAAGLVGQLRPTDAMTKLIQYSTQLYATLEEETGLGTGWKRCGSLSVARTEERMTSLMRTLATARAFGVEAERLTPAEAGEKWPLMRTDDLVGAVWLPGDGKANPTDLTQALARGARSHGAIVCEDTQVTDLEMAGNRITGVRTQNGLIECDTVVNCAGQWAAQIGAMAGVKVPLHSVEHFYVVTDPIEGVHRDLPVMRDQDGYIYFKEEVGGLVMGGFEPDAKPWVGPYDIPDPFVFQLLEDDWEQFAILMENAITRVPALETAGMKKLYNGPESFTPDNNFIMGEAVECPNMYVLAGFNSTGIASAGGAGMAMAEWIVAGEPDRDLWPVDIRRFAPFNSNETWLRERTKETLGLHYAIPWPNKEPDTGRPLRRSPIHHLLDDSGAVMGNRNGWERPNWFAPEGVARVTEYSFGHQNWRPYVNAEHQATRDQVALLDQTAFSKFLLRGPDVEAALQWICANDMAVAPGTTVYTGILNDRGGYESDVTVTRTAIDEYLLVTGSAQGTRDEHYLNRHLPAGSRVEVVDVTSSYAVLGIMGPQSRTLLNRLSNADLGNEAFPFYTSQKIDIGPVPVRATRVSYVGDLGWELYIPTEYAVTAYERLVDAGADLGLTAVGHYAVDAMRIEKGYRAWGRELTPDRTPVEAGMTFTCKLASGVDFRGREAVEKAKAAGPRARLVSVTLNDPDAVLWGGELLLRNGEPRGFVTSAAYSAVLGRCVAMAYVEPEVEIADADYVRGGTYQVEAAGVVFDAEVSLKAPYDPTGSRLKG